MSTDPTEYPRQIEPTQAVPYNPYELPRPYSDIPPPPPPPSTRRRKRLLIALVSSACLIVLLVGVAFAILHFSSQSGSVKATPGSTPTAIATTPILTPTPTATAITRVYDAMAIMQDLQQAGLQAYGLQYSSACGNTINDLQSRACWRNPVVCNLQCDEDEAWPDVYDNQADAESIYQQLVQSSGPLPQVFLEGHCILAGNLMNGTYIKIVAYDCQ